MYLSELKLWNFRKFGSGNNDLDLDNPDLIVNFNKGINVLIGENDTGKTAIIDAIKIVLRTHSYEWIKIELEDFYNDMKRLRIECLFEDLKPEEAKNFIKWLGINEIQGEPQSYLKVFADVSRDNSRILSFDIKAGVDSEGYRIPAEAREYLKTIYLKPLRDAKAELIPKKYSRLSQILIGHPAFKDKDDNHELLIYRQFREVEKQQHY